MSAGLTAGGLPTPFRDDWLAEAAAETSSSTDVRSPFAVELEEEAPSPPTLRRGSHGDAVSRLQRALRAAGHAVAVDGVFGRGTDAAVRAFQASAGLSVDGVAGPATWSRLAPGGAVPDAGDGLGPATGVPARPEDVNPGTLVLRAPGRRFEYRFTAEDLVWTAKLLVHEAGGRDDPDNAAVLWAMFNRYALFAHRVFPTFTAFLRAYSTTLQPVLLSAGAAARHAHKPPSEYVRTGGTYPGTDIPRGQLRRHLEIQAAPWSAVPTSARALAVRALTGRLPSPGIGLASEFASTRIYFRQRHGRDPNDAEFRRFTTDLAARKRWRWVGDVPGLDQRRNAFFLDLRAADLPPDAVRVLPPDGAAPDEGEHLAAAAETPPAEREPAADMEPAGSLLESVEEEARSWLSRAFERAMLLTAIASGERSDNDLTNRVFFLRHPDRRGTTIGREERALAREWLEIRDRQVVPMLLSGPRIGPVHDPSQRPPGPALRIGVAADAVVSPLAITQRGLRVSRQRQPGTIAAVVLHMTSRGPANRSRSVGYRQPAVKYALDHYIDGREGYPHYVVDLNGTIYVTCDERFTAGHAGWGGIGGAATFRSGWAAPAWWSAVWSSKGATTPLDLLPSGSRSPNERTIGIELIILPDLSYTEEQYRSLAQLVADLRRRHPDLRIPAAPSRGLLGHEDFTPVSGAGGRADARGGWDPGAHRSNPYFDWSRLWTQIQATAPGFGAGDSASEAEVGEHEDVPDMDAAEEGRYEDTLGEAVLAEDVDGGDSESGPFAAGPADLDEGLSLEDTWMEDADVARS